MDNAPTIPSGTPRLALVLGAGGARGFAHIGALRVLDRHRVPLDLIVGASIGSLFGAAYASGLSPAAIEEAARATRIPPLIRPRPCRRGLLDPSGVRDLLRRYFGDRRFEDLDRPLAMLTVSLRTGEPFLVREGSLVDGLLASMAIPFVFPSVTLAGDQLIDGGIADGLPIKFARQLGAEAVIAVDADNHARQPLDRPGLRRLTRLLTKRLAVRRGASPTGALLIARLLRLAGSGEERQLPDVLIRAPFGRITSWHYHLWPRMIALGEQAAESALPELLALIGRQSDHVEQKSSDTEWLDPLADNGTEPDRVPLGALDAPALRPASGAVSA